MDQEQIKLAYAVAYASPSGYVGALLLTDYKGFPLEFRYTDPIIPTKIQQVLYGEGLEKYIKMDVIFDSLVKIFADRVSVLFVQDEDLLNYQADNIVIVRLSSTKVPPLSSLGELSNVKNAEYLLQTTHSNNPVRLQFSQDFVCEGEKFDKIINSLILAGEFMDVDEPLNRVYKTIELVCNQEI